MINPPIKPSCRCHSDGPTFNGASSNIVDTIKMRKNGWLSKHYVLEVKDLGRVFSFLNN